MFFARHRSIRNALSSYIDSRLAPEQSEALERHLQSCQACRADSERMRALVSALRELPAVRAPRSFALTPEQAPPAARPPARLPPLALGMRLASAGVAVVLAVLMIADLGAGSGGRRDEAAERIQSAPASERAGPEADSAGAPVPTATSPSAGESQDPAFGAGPAGLSPTSTPQPAGEDKAAGGPETQAAAGAAAQESEGSDDGVDALRIAEIALAAALAVLLLGSVALSRRTARDES